jgi:hypothetical protein
MMRRNMPKTATAGKPPAKKPLTKAEQRRRFEETAKELAPTTGRHSITPSLRSCR